MVLPHYCISDVLIVKQGVVPTMESAYKYNVVVCIVNIIMWYIFRIPTCVSPQTCVSFLLVNTLVVTLHFKYLAVDGQTHMKHGLFI